MLARQRRTLRSVQPPSPRQVHAHLPGDRRRCSALKGIALFFAVSFLYAVSLLAIVALPWWPAKLLCVIPAAFFMALLYLVAHDAAHGSLTPSAALNILIGRLGFLPSLHAYSAWLISHNVLHHGFTNLRGWDYVWAPYSREEFARLPSWRRLLERCYRTLPGLGLYYLVELWGRTLLFPPKAVRVRIRCRLVHALDCVAVLGFLVMEAIGLLAWQRYLEQAFGLPKTSVAGVLVPGLLLPFLVMTWSAGLVTFLHHTHPRIRWYADRQQWCYFRGQVQGTVHAVLPWPLAALTGNVLAHTAHHADPRIPHYHLGESQRRLEAAYPEIVVETWGLRACRRALAICQLYDYQNHRWLDFAGRPTSETPARPA
jgi:omega-6 fatty acid desaturase (delta-12 desaturase)